MGKLINVKVLVSESYESLENMINATTLAVRLNRNEPIVQYVAPTYDGLHNSLMWSALVEEHECNPFT